MPGQRAQVPGSQIVLVHLYITEVCLGQHRIRRSEDVYLMSALGGCIYFEQSHGEGHPVEPYQSLRGREDTTSCHTVWSAQQSIYLFGPCQGKRIRVGARECSRILDHVVPLHGDGCAFRKGNADAVDE